MQFKNRPDYNDVFGDDPVHVYAVEKIDPEYKWKEEWGKPKDCLLGHSDKNMLGDILINTRSGEVYLFSTENGEWGISGFPSIQASRKEILTLQSMLRKTEKRENLIKNDMYAYEVRETSDPRDIKSQELRDLANESGEWVYATAQSSKDKDPFEVLFMPSQEQAGITQMSQTTWTRAASLENAIDRYLGYKNQTLERLFRRKGFKDVA